MAAGVPPPGAAHRLLHPAGSGRTQRRVMPLPPLFPRAPLLVRCRHCGLFSRPLAGKWRGWISLLPCRCHRRQGRWGWGVGLSEMRSHRLRCSAAPAFRGESSRRPEIPSVLREPIRNNHDMKISGFVIFVCLFAFKPVELSESLFRTR